MKKIAVALVAAALFISLPFLFKHFVPSPPTPSQGDKPTLPVATGAPAPQSPTITPAASTSPGQVFYRDKVVVLMYHHLDSQERPGLVISPERFASQLAMLHTRGYNVISLDQLQQFLKGGPVPPNAVLITFDDGYESVYKYALPALRREQMPAVAFTIVSYAGHQVGVHRYFGWEEAREMAAAGFITQSHTYNLHNYGTHANGKQGPLMAGPLQGQTPDAFVNMIYQDLLRSRQEIEAQLKQPVYALALPFGAAGPLAIQAATRAGFKLVFTVQPGVVSHQSNPLALPRVNAGSPAISPTKLDELIRQTARATTQAPTRPARRPAGKGTRRI
ncbi:MAG: hypothetical protein PWQ18_567 [Clostridia bacterium]|nr:hypothetical protein [Clostridia bacterium]